MGWEGKVVKIWVNFQNFKNNFNFTACIQGFFGRNLSYLKIEARKSTWDEPVPNFVSYGLFKIGSWFLVPG